MTASELIDYLVKYDACEEALYWVSDRDLATAWEECERADWMIWLAATVKIDHKKIVIAAAACARCASLHTSDPRVIDCIDTVERWCRDEATLEDVRAALKGALATRVAARAETAAKWAAVWTARAAEWAVEWPAAGATRWAAIAAAAWAAEAEPSELADVVRKTVPLAMVEKLATK